MDGKSYERNSLKDPDCQDLFSKLLPEIKKAFEEYERVAAEEKKDSGRTATKTRRTASHARMSYGE